MTKLLFALGLTLSTGALAVDATAQSADPIPMREFFRNPERAFYRISGDGARCRSCSRGSGG
jgi:hypothetical protein